MATKTISQQIGEFLRQRRERLTPTALGLPAGPRRRTPGLRREEVAQLCGISVDWYTRLEQGRESLPSTATVDALSQGMRLNAVERGHLMSLALQHTRRVFVKERVPANLVELIEGLPTAVYVIGARYDLLCWNRAAVELFRDFAKIPVDERNTLYQMFTSPEVRARYPDWEDEARGMLEGFRVTYDFWSHSPEFNELVERISARSPEFRRWWKKHDIRKRSSGAKVMTHRTLGMSRVPYATFQSNDNPDLRVVIYGKPIGTARNRRASG